MNARRTAAVLAMAAALLLLLDATARTHAQSATSPGCPGTSIRAPFAGAVVSGTVEILGSARIEGFRFYKLEWAPDDEPESWRAVSQTIERSVSNGLLDRWDTRPLPDGGYRLKLTAVDERAAERCRFVVEGLVLANASAPAAPEGSTPFPSPTMLDRDRPTEVARADSALDARASAVESDEQGEPAGDDGGDGKADEDSAAEPDEPEEGAAGEAGGPDDASAEAVDEAGSEGAGMDDPDAPAAAGREDADAGAEAAPSTRGVEADAAPDDASSETAVGSMLRSILVTFLLTFLITAVLAALLLIQRRGRATEPRP